ncbi:MAG: linear amide C-N hydrolase, partial [Spirochaetaceae bacterium]|nr:linear amide C-N hydrolase [Spirochaetaceae bacterium]
GGMIFGRTYDWNDCAVMIIHTKPDNGYESVSTCCLSHMGLDRNWKPANKFPADAAALGLIYVPMDGMNEKGLYIADLMAGDREQTAQERGNISVTTTDAIRFVLDKAATVDEAIAILENHDMHSVIGAAHHFAVCDNAGRSVVVEWADNQMYVSETKILTNHYTADSPKKDDGLNEQSINSRMRFDKLKETYDNAQGAMNAEAIRDALNSVHASQYSTSGEELTAWSAVFEPNSKKITYYFRENYDKPIVVEF